MRIDSPANPRIRAALALRERAGRRATGQALVDGVRESRRALAAGVEVRSAFVDPTRLRGREAEAAIHDLVGAGVEPIELSPRAFERLAFGDRAEGLILVVTAPGTDLAQLRPGPDPFVLVTEDVEKPGNLGAILRTADAVGCDALIAVGGTDLFNPNVVRASAGTVFHVALAAADAETTIAWLHDRAIRILAARVEGGRPYDVVDLQGPLALVVGSEASGLSPAWTTPGIEALSIPMYGVADSLNVAAAAAVLAYAARRQRGPIPGDARISNGGPA